MNKLISLLRPYVYAVILVITALHFLSYANPLDFQKKVKKNVISVYIKDSIPVHIDLIYDDASKPDKYYTYIETPVCEDEICYDLKVHLYWDLMGNFLAYEENKEDPFTKFDHEKFTAKDHKKMHSILADKSSVLGKYRVENLVSKKKTIYSSELDGLTGATNPAISDKIVPGAVYSAYTLWNIVNGPISDSIQAYTENLVDDDLLIKMMASDNYHLQMYGMRHLEESNPSFPKLLMRLVEKGQKYVPLFAIAKLPPSTWANPKQQGKLITMLETLNFEMENEVLNGLAKTKIAPSNIGLLISQINYLKETQYKKIFKLLKANTSSFKDSDQQTLMEISKNPKNKFAPYAKQLIKN